MNHAVEAVGKSRAAVRASERATGQRSSPRGAELSDAELKGISAGSSDDGRCSADPMARTDRYRLVTPYFSSSKDL